MRLSLLRTFFQTMINCPSVRKRLIRFLVVHFDFTKAGFNLDVGGVMVADFTRKNVQDALDFGPGLNFFSKWSLFGPLELSSDITAYYLFPLPKFGDR